MKKSKIKLSCYYFIMFLILEVAYKLSIFGFSSFFKLDSILIVIYTIILTFFYTIISRLFSEKKNFIIVTILTIFNIIKYGVYIYFHKIFDSPFSLSYLSLTDQGLEFMDAGMTKIIEYFYIVILLLIPIVLLIIFRKKINFNRHSKKKLINKIIVLFITGLIYYVLTVSSKPFSQAHDLIYKMNNISLTQEKLGVSYSVNLELKRLIFGFEEEIKISPKPDDKEDPKEVEVKYEDNILNYDFEKLYSSTNNKTIKNMTEYILNDQPTQKNKYTGLFKGKNLVFITAESFSQIAISEEITPTLYKMANNGFVFNNFYTPVNLSTLGGEFQVLTGQFAEQTILNSCWKAAKSESPYGLGHVFKDKDYNTYAFHNGEYYFQGRDKYMKNIGFTNYLACKNGMEKLINCQPWPRSDLEMISKTMNKYINDKPFLAYYMTNSGHFPYSKSNMVSKNNWESVEGLDASTKSKAYVASIVDLDKGLEILMQKLEENNQLDNTVFVVVADHYPYDLSLSEVNELSDYERDSIAEINHNTLIVYNSNMDKVVINKVSSQLDVLPTIYNLFDIPYESRLFMGKDILSTEPGLAFFKDRSWVTDKGTYFASSKKFIKKENVEIEEDYIKNINQKVSNKINMSKLIIEQNYYKYLEVKN